MLRIFGGISIIRRRYKMTAVEKELKELIEIELDDEGKGMVYLYDFVEELGKDKLDNLLEQLGYSYSHYSEYAYEIEKLNKKEE